MRTLIIIILIGVLCQPKLSHGQSVDRHLLSSTGHSFTNSNISLDFTIGEIVVATLNAQNISLTQGFNQPPYSTGVFVDDFDYGSNLITIYPNPTHNYVFLEFKTNQYLKISWAIFNASGHFLTRSNDIRIEKTETFKKEINLEHYPSGIYFIIVYDEFSVIHRGKIIKL